MMSEEVLLELGFLTEEERDTINTVIAKDVQMRKLEQSRISRLRKELGELKEDGLPENDVDVKNDQYCARCQTYFGVIWNRGALCSRCERKVCKICRGNTAEGSWMCILCVKVREVKAQSGAWFFQGQKGKDEKLFGSLLVRQSLRRLPGSESKQATEQGVGNHIQVAFYKDKIQPHDHQHQTNIDYNGRSSNKQTEQVDQTSNNSKWSGAVKTAEDEQDSDISDADLSDEGSSHDETYSPREGSERSLSKGSADNESPSRGQHDDEARPGDESSSWKADEYEPGPGDKSSSMEADEYEVGPGDKSSSMEAYEYKPGPGDKSSSMEADEYYKVGPGDKSSSMEEDEYKVGPGDKSSSMEEDEYKVGPGDKSSSMEADEYEIGSGDESSRWNAEEHEERPGNETTSIKVPGVEALQAGDLQGLGDQAGYVHQEDVSHGVVKPELDYEIGGHGAINSEVPTTAEESSSLDSRETALRAFSQTFAKSVQTNHGLTPRDDLDGSHVIDNGDDRRSSDPRHEIHGVFNTDDGSSISETSGYVTPTRSEETSSKRTPSISGDEGASTPKGHSQQHAEEFVPVIITTGAGSSKSNRSSIVDFEDDLDVSFSKYEGGLGHKMLKDQTSMGSRESIMSYYSNAGGDVYGKYPVTGKIYFGIKYDAVAQEFQIQIHQARDIAAVDEKNQISDPYIKTYLLPDRSRNGKRKSKVKKNTINPIFDEVITYKTTYDDILQRTLWLAVWNYDRFGHNDFLGEVLLPIDQYQQSGFSLEDPDPQWYTLCERQGDDFDVSYNGEIVLALKYVPASELVSKKKKKKKKGEEEKGELHINIIEANNLLGKDSNGFSDPFCKSYLLPDKSKKTKQKTAVVKKNLNPKWNYRFVYDNLSHEELMDKVLELTVWDFDRGSSNDFLGGVRLGLGTALQEWDDSNTDEQAAWNKMLNNQNDWNQVTLTLRDNMGNHKCQDSSIDLTGINANSNQNGHSLSPQASMHEKFAGDELIRHSEYHHPRASKIDAAITASKAANSSPTPAATQDQDKKPLTLAELAGMNDAAKVKEDDSNQMPSPHISITDDNVETSSNNDDETDSLVRHSEFYQGSRSPKPIRRKFGGSRSSSLLEDSEKRRPTLVDILQKNGNSNGSDKPGNHSMPEEDLGSRDSIYSNAGLYSNNSVSGEILLGYQYTHGTFKIKIFEARGLTAIDKKKNTSDPYVKVYLLPDQSRAGKRKTKTKRGTLDPEFNEEMLFKIGSTELLMRTMWLSFWHYDKFGRNEFLGEVRIPLGGYNGSEVHPKWCPLLEMLPDSFEEHQSELIVALMYRQTEKKGKKEGKTGKLYVKVIEARNLPPKDSDNLSDPFCKSYLLPDPTKKTKRKTPVMKRNLNPHWDHKFTYDNVTLDDLRNNVLELTVWDHDLATSNDFLGGVRIGLGTSGEEWDDCEGDEVTLWQFLLSKPNTWTQNTLSLRSQMSSRKGLKI